MYCLENTSDYVAFVVIFFSFTRWYVNKDNIHCTRILGRYLIFVFKFVSVGFITTVVIFTVHCHRRL